jgi:hypothetical protein
MAIGFVGKGLGMMAAVVPLGVVTPPAFFDSGDTYRLTTETGDALKTETGDYIERHYYMLATEAGDRLLTEESQLLEV